MTEPRPSAAELTAAVADFLDQVRADPSRGTSFHLLVAANALRIVERELAGRAGIEALDAVRAALPGSPGTEAELAGLVRAGTIPRDDADLRAYLVRSVRLRAAIDSPQYAAVTEATTRWGSLGG